MGGSILATPVAGVAQQAARTARVGVLVSGMTIGGYGLESFRQGLREHGYSEGRDVVIARNVDVLVVPGTLQARVAKQATRTIPIVFASSGDPVASGLVTSLARPGGNLTGLCSLGQELIAKRLELLR